MIPACIGCKQQTMEAEEVRNSLSRYGHGYICNECGSREAFDGDFIAKAARTKNTLIRTDGSREELPNGELTLAEMYAAIGCDMVERVVLDDKRVLWCDEEGLMKANPRPNSEASAMYRAAYPHVPPQELGIVGNAILSEEV